MASASVYSAEGKQSGSVELPERLFAAPGPGTGAVHPARFTRP